MNVSLEVLSEDMVEATKQFAKDNHIDRMKRVKLDTQSSTITVECEDGAVRKFAVLFFGIQDEDSLFYWADSVEEFSDYTRDTCTEVRQGLEDNHLLEASHYVLHVSNDAIMTARELDQDGGRYAISEDDALLSRYSVDELLSIVFTKAPVRGIYTVQGKTLSYYFGILSSVS